MAFSLKTIFGDRNASLLKKYSSVVPKVNSLEPSISALSDAELKDKTKSFKERLHGKSLPDQKKILEEILPEAFALVREASKRTLKQRHFDVQLIGGAILNGGNIAEMRTGEGKTLVATLPAYLNALTGRGVHIVTVNDYLSRRDAVWMGQVYDLLGLTTGVINHETSYLYDPKHRNTGDDKTLDEKRDETGSFHVVHDYLRPVTRREAYYADITYGTNNEFGFDYLRDNLEYEEGKLRQREFHYAIVDEIDSILIDEARTPLIISSPTVDSEKLYSSFAQMVRDFVKDEDFKVDEKNRSIA
jgi:preprotein translocase subunit SecA